MRIELHNARQIPPYIRKVRSAADMALKSLRKALAGSNDSLALLRDLKFNKMGRHPLEDRELNLIEQLNQTATCLVSFKAAKLIFRQHPDCGGLRLNLMTRGGFDIESIAPDLIKAEAFAAVTPKNNHKLADDLERLRNAKSEFRAVYFAAPGFAAGRLTALETVPGVEVWCIEI